MITLATLEQHTEQQVFDHIALHLLTQNAVSMRNCVCAYRGTGGLMCAAGAVMSDDEYDSAFESMPWAQLVSAGYVPSAHHMLIRKLQGVHDGGNVAAWPALLRRVAANHDLSTKVVDEFRSPQS